MLKLGLKDGQIYLTGMDRKICLYVQKSIVQVQITFLFSLQDLISLPVLSSCPPTRSSKCQTLAFLQ